MKVQIVKLDEKAIIPSFAKQGDACVDLIAVSKKEEIDYIQYGTGLAMEIPEGYVGLIFPRSSISNQDLNLANSVGVVDSGYRGEFICRFKKYFNKEKNSIRTEYKIGDKIAQLMIIPIPQIEFEKVDKLSESERGNSGFGSSGN
jgi:dUTP pyrophosphatase